MSKELWPIEEIIGKAREKTHLLIQFAGKRKRRTILSANDIQIIESYQDEILNYLDEIQTKMSKISTGKDIESSKELGESSLEFRLNRSQYYRKSFEKLVSGLRIKRLEGYQPYNEFVERRIGSAFGYIHGLERRIGQIRADWRSLDQLYLTTNVTILTQEIDQQQIMAGEQQKIASKQQELAAEQQARNVRIQGEIKDVQIWGERALWGALAPYYVSNLILHIFDCDHQKWCSSPLGQSNIACSQIITGLIWAIFIILAMARERMLKKQRINGSTQA